MIGTANFSRMLTIRSKQSKKDLHRRIKEYRALYALILIPLLVIFVFNYIPMVGVLMAFKDYKITLGFMGIFTSPDVGFEFFRKMFSGPGFPNVIKNTFIISFLKMLFGFPAPLLFALMLNELRSLKFKKIVQTISYLPNFLSMVILYGILLAVISPNYGILNMLRQSGGLDTVAYLSDTKYFRSILVIMDIWAGTGWGAILYLAAIAGVDQEMYEAADMDGATRLQRIWHITLPSITPIIVFLLVLRCGSLLSVSFEQVFMLYSPAVYSVGDVIGTYTYRKGLVNMEYGFSSAVGLFNSLVSFALIVSTNKIANKLGHQGVW